MKSYQYILIFFIILLTIASCQKEIEYDGEWLDPKVVLYSKLEPDSTITVFVARSKRVTDGSNESLTINNARVEIYENEQIIETLTIGTKGKYTSTKKSSLNKEYKIKAFVPGYDAVEGTASLIPPVIIDKITDLGKQTSQFGSEYHSFGLTITDDPNTVDYYQVVAYRVSYSTYTKEIGENDTTIIQDSSRYLQELYFETDETTPDLIIANGSPIFSDALFNGKTYMQNLKAMTFFSGEQVTMCYFYLYRIDEAFYKYMKSIALNYGVSDMGGLFAEPVPTYSNVQGGLGIVCARTVTVDSIEIKGSN